MKFYITILSLSACLLMSCGPSAEEVFMEDTISITNYLEENGLLDDAQVTDSGIYYIIEEEGNDVRPGLNDKVKCNYTGYLPNDEPFDAGTNVSFILGATIEGWRQGIPLIGEGGSIRLFIPSELAYGMEGNNSIEGNQEIFFDVDLLEVN